MSYSSTLETNIKAMCGIPLEQKYSPDQERDENGRFAGGGGDVDGQEIMNSRDPRYSRYRQASEERWHGSNVSSNKYGQVSVGTPGVHMVTISNAITHESLRTMKPNDQKYVVTDEGREFDVIRKEHEFVFNPRDRGSSKIHVPSSQLISGISRSSRMRTKPI